MSHKTTFKLPAAKAIIVIFSQSDGYPTSLFFFFFTTETFSFGDKFTIAPHKHTVKCQEDCCLRLYGTISNLKLENYVKYIKQLIFFALDLKKLQPKFTHSKVKLKKKKLYVTS